MSRHSSANVAAFRPPVPLFALFASVLALAATTFCPGQTNSQFDSLPGYEQYRSLQRDRGQLVRGGTVGEVRWSTDTQTVYYTVDGQRMRCNLSNGEISTVTDDEHDAASGDNDQENDRNRRGRRGVPRGQQRDVEPAPEGDWIAACREWNVVLENTETGETIDVTTDGRRKLRYGKASWVYGEELDQNTAMWWSPDARRLAFYRFDEQDVQDYYLLNGWAATNTTLMIEGYPKAGAANPVADLLIYDIETGETIDIDATTDPEEYIYQVRFSPDGSELLFNRTNRLQNVLELVAAEVRTGQTRVILTETQAAWQDNRPEIRFLEDGERFIWATERSGYKHYELRHLDGSRLATLTTGQFPDLTILRIDEPAEHDDSDAAPTDNDLGRMFYITTSGDHPLNRHLNCVNLDGSDQTRLTPRGLTYDRFNISPDGKWIIARGQSSTEPPRMMLLNDSGELVATLAEANTQAMDSAGARPAELFTFKAADGETDLFGKLYKPVDFDPEKQYPLIIFTYGGPGVQIVRNTFSSARPETAFGFLIAMIDNRGTPNRGKAFETASYQKLGQVDLDDQAAGVRYLAKRPYVDGDRVGIYGSSYGGYIAALAVLRYPNVFHVAVATAAVTDWRHYDTIYTERYMRTPQENEAGYDAGSCMTYVDQLSGNLLLLHGMVDDNVHPANVFQLANVLQRADKRFDMMLYPNYGHGVRGANELRWEYFYDHLIDGQTTTTTTDQKRTADAGASGTTTPSSTGSETGSKTGSPLNRPIHFELHSSDVQTTLQFFEAVFDWEYEKWEGGEQEYYFATTGSGPGIDGGIMPSLDGEQRTVNIIQVESIDRSIETVTEHGGEIVVEKMAITGIGWLAYAVDPTGVLFGMMEADPSAE